MVGWRSVDTLQATRQRRAMHIKEHDVFRFAEELSSIDWSHHNLVFLDEVSFDNRGMIRRRGYSIKGRKLATSSGSQECQIWFLACTD
ncbi:hypothetical protein F441_18676 [Phytophthora nicotianae CJ01A1]|uniref:Transposase n=3 Tax=Phytophthora nicotianae TaxID=4792 RepID=V9E887_PHYNI|nr:hypothetical protein F443_18824 [Phytophthora nicotianae P1569]ETO63516.1 hypothetical protein F444_18810 [Phytophthora nicotianae P1976]ETP04614.1 hypothetical protein F441_18676 [Phytophthora nicotianae CJ01A1]